MRPTPCQRRDERANVHEGNEDSPRISSFVGGDATLNRVRNATGARKPLIVPGMQEEGSRKRKRPRRQEEEGEALTGRRIRP